jgi:hypothetical protein
VPWGFIFSTIEINYSNPRRKSALAIRPNEAALVNIGVIEFDGILGFRIGWPGRVFEQVLGKAHIIKVVT